MHVFTHNYIDRSYSHGMVDVFIKIFCMKLLGSLLHRVYLEVCYLRLGNLIDASTREGRSDGAQVEATVTSPQTSPDDEAPEISQCRSQSRPLEQVNSREVGSPSSDLRFRGRSLLVDHFRESIVDPSPSPNIMNGDRTARSLDVNETFDELSLLERRSPYERSENSLRSPRGVIDMAPSPLSRVELCENGLEVTIFLEL